MDATRGAAVQQHDQADDDIKTRRLAELVHHLTGCSPEGALHAVRRCATSAADPDAALDVLARAMVSVRRGVDLREHRAHK